MTGKREDVRTPVDTGEKDDFIENVCRAFEKRMRSQHRTADAM